MGMSNRSETLATLTKPAAAGFGDGEIAIYVADANAAGAVAHDEVGAEVINVDAAGSVFDVDGTFDFADGE